MYFCQVKIFAIMKRITLLLFSLILLLFPMPCLLRKTKEQQLLGFITVNLFDTETTPNK